MHTNATHILTAVLFAAPWAAGGIYAFVTRRIPWKGGGGAATGSDAVVGGVLLIVIGAYAAYMILTH